MILRNAVDRVAQASERGVRERIRLACPKTTSEYFTRELERQVKPDGGSLPGFAFCLDMAPVRLYDVFGDR